MKYEQMKILFGITSLCFLCLHGKEDAPVKKQPPTQPVSSITKENLPTKKHVKKASIMSITRMVVLEPNIGSDEYKPVNQTVFNIEPTVSQTRPQDPVHETGHVKNALIGRHMNKLSLNKFDRENDENVQDKRRTKDHVGTFLKIG